MVYQFKGLAKELGYETDNYVFTNVYLKETGDIVAIGGKYCGIECVSTKEMVTFKNNNGKLEINGVDYKKYQPYYVIFTDDYMLFYTK